ncbi:interferon regulatory factor 9 isoform X1 [Pelobates fuscus]|uniref:interferon regulatory factor 9 isoform X1 n=1 Tax=Pelobates fuscus TaxID=191477 RepID=UPI002FE4C79C
MATAKARTTRKLKPWLVEQVESGKFHGLVWDDDKKTCFRIPWKHAGKQDFRHDEDAAIFKAWAVYKNKLHPGDKLDAAAWKTRLRCALNKSPEFQEVPERSQLDISEPYKVYRIVPPGEQVVPSSGKTSRKRKSAQEKDSSSDEMESNELEKKHHIVVLAMPLVKEETVTSTNFQEDSGMGSDSSSPETLNTLHNPDPLIIIPAQPVPISHTDMLIKVFYSGVEVLQRLVGSGGCKLSAGNPPVQIGCGMEHVQLPVPAEPLDVVTQDKTNKLLEVLQAGVMLESNIDGIFAQRQKGCSGRVYWLGPCASQEGEPNKLERDTLVKLFDTQKFQIELENYRIHGGKPPDCKVTLCFGEEISDFDCSDNKVITCQIEQIMAAEMVRDTNLYLLSPHVSDPLLQGPPAPYMNPLPALDIH